MRQRHVPVFQLHAEDSVRHLFQHPGRYAVVGSGIRFFPKSDIRHPKSPLHGLVRTHGPFSVTATQCSKCAEFDPSLVTAVHLSPRTFDSGPPAFTIGSIASTMPSFSRGFLFLRST